MYQYPKGTGIVGIPRELFETIMLQLPGTDLIQLCTTNRWFREYCTEANESFWSKKLLQDYPNSANVTLTPDMSEKRLYLGLELNQIKIFDVYHWKYINDNRSDIINLKSIIIMRNQTVKEMLNNLSTVYTHNQPIIFIVFQDKHNQRVLSVYDVNTTDLNNLPWTKIYYSIKNTKLDLYNHKLNDEIWNQLDHVIIHSD